METYVHRRGRAVDDKNETLSGGLTILKPQKNVNAPKCLWSGAIFFFHRGVHKKKTHTAV